MTGGLLTDRDEGRLLGVHPDLVIKIRTVVAIMARAGSPMFVVQGVRTLIEQQALYAKGRTEKGPIVTHADGIRVLSNHQVRADGFGHAVDCAFVGVEPFALTHPWSLFGETVSEAGLRWGGDFATFPDDPHVELITV